MSFKLEENLIHQLVQQGWFCSDQLIPFELSLELLQIAKEKCQLGDFRPALTGQGLHREERSHLRSDKISWINDWQQSQALQSYSLFCQELQLFLARELRLALRRFEGHFSLYEKGDFYKKHLDQHIRNPHRWLSLILYLSGDEACSGGELVLYSKDDSTKIEKRISPKAGRIVCFLSGQIYHHVETSYFNRYALTGWFRDDEVVLF